MDQKKIGEFIANLRKERGLTQKQLAEEIGVSDKTISKWECGNGLPEMSSIPLLILPLFCLVCYMVWQFIFYCYQFDSV